MVTFAGSAQKFFKDLFPLDPVIRRGIYVTMIWLVIVNGFAIIAFNRLNVSPDTAFKWMAEIDLNRPKTWNVIDIHNRWDSYWYLDIAEKGYYLRGENDIANVVFPPLYPLLVRMMIPVAGGNPVLAGWIVSSIFLIPSVILLIRLTQRFHPDLDPILPVIFLLVYPTAFILNAVYSESLFLFLSLGTVYYARQEKFFTASVFAAFASATRIAGLFLCTLLLIEFIQSKGFKALFTRHVLPLALAPSGILCFFLYHWVAFGDFFLYLKIQDNWGRDFDIESADYVIRNSAYWVNMGYDMFFFSMVAVIGILAIKRLRISYGVYMLVSAGIALSTGTFLGLPRYSMMLFPIFLMASSIRSMTVRSAWLLISILFMAMNIICFANHYWVG